MIPQVPHVGETLSTLVTHEGLLASVDQLVGFQAVALVEAAFANAAGERLLSGVDALVSVQVSHVVEGLPTCIARVWFLSCVNKLMKQMQRKILITFVSLHQVFFFTLQKNNVQTTPFEHILLAMMLC